MTLNKEVDRLEAILYDLIQIPNPTDEDQERINAINETLEELWEEQDNE